VVAEEGFEPPTQGL